MSNEELIDAAYAGDIGLNKSIDAVHHTIAELDRGAVRVAHKHDGEWVVNEWVKRAISLYFRITEVETFGAGPFEYYDKIPTKTGLKAAGVRVVPPGVIRYGAFCEPGVVVMPGYVNIGAHVGAGTMVDTWATVGSCAQVGRNVHLSGGVGIGGVLEPPGARPVIIEDGAIGGFIMVSATAVNKFECHFAGCHGRTRSAVIEKLVPVVAELVVARYRNLFRKLNFNFNGGARCESINREAHGTQWKTDVLWWCSKRVCFDSTDIAQKGAGW